MIGEVLGDRYRLDSLLGEGGMGRVFAAHDTVENRTVAVKVLAGRTHGEEEEKRLLREFRAVSSLDHPGIVSMYDMGIHKGAAFLVMELVRGQSLKELSTRITWTPERSEGEEGALDFYSLMGQVCEALEYIHSRGVIHRDIKPGNIMLTDEGSVKLMDFGLAKEVDLRQTATQAGQILGTVAYMAPEQAKGFRVDARTDLYSLGVVVYELLTSRLPFSGESPIAIILQHLREPPMAPRLLEPSITLGLEEAALRLLEKDPSDRFQSALELWDELKTVRSGMYRRITPRRPTARKRVTAYLPLPPLVGRGDEMAYLTRQLNETIGGTARLVVIRGEAGVGKTRLLSELKTLALERRVRFFEGRCLPGQRFPYRPFADIFRRLVSSLGPTGGEYFQEVLGDRLNQLAKFMPDLSEKGEAEEVTVPSGVPSAQAEKEKASFYEAIATVLGRIANEVPLLLLVEDIQWADAETADLLTYVLGDLSGQRLMVCLSVREEDMESASPAASIVEGEQLPISYHPLVLRRLSPEDVLAMVSGMLSLTPDRCGELAESLSQETEGNPFFVQEVVKSLIEEGALERMGEGWQYESHRLKRITLPGNVTEALRNRIQRLSTNAKEVLSLAAVIGRGFDFDILLDASRMGEDELSREMDVCLAAQLVSEDYSLGEDRYDFSHGKIRELVYESVPQRRRRKLHQRVAESLESRYVDRIDEYLGELAYHFERGEDSRRAVAYSVRAGTRSARLYANQDAIQQLSTALELVRKRDELGILVDDDRQEVMVARARRGDVYRLLGRLDESARDYEELLKLAREWRDETHEAEALAATGTLSWIQGEHDRALEYFEAAYSLQEKIGDMPGTAKTLNNMAITYYRLGNIEQALKHQERSLRIEEYRNNREGVVRAYNNLGLMHQALGQREKALYYHRAALEIQKELRDKRGQLSSLNNMGAIAESVGDLRDAEANFKAALELAREVEDRQSEAICLENLGEVLKSQGRLSNAREHLLRAIEIAKEIGDRGLEADALWRLGVVHKGLGVLAEAVKSGEQAIEVSREVNEQDLLVYSHIFLADSLAELGEVDRALELAARAREMAESQGPGSLIPLVLGLMAGIRNRKGLNQEAVELAAEARGRAQGSDNALTQLAVELAYAEALASTGHLSEAADNARQLQSQAADSGAEELELRAVWLSAAGAASPEDEKILGSFAERFKTCEYPALRYRWHLEVGTRGAARGDETAMEPLDACLEIIEELLRGLPPWEASIHLGSLKGHIDRAFDAMKLLGEEDRIEELEERLRSASESI